MIKLSHISVGVLLATSAILAFIGVASMVASFIFIKAQP
jgi:hypothetical protein